MAETEIELDADCEVLGDPDGAAGPVIVAVGAELATEDGVALDVGGSDGLGVSEAASEAIADSDAVRHSEAPPEGLAEPLAVTVADGCTDPVALALPLAVARNDKPPDAAGDRDAVAETLMVTDAGTLSV